MSKLVLVTGVTGQTGSFLAELLLEKGYQVHGVYRRTSADSLRNIRPILDRITLHKGDLCDPLSIDRIIRDIRPLHAIFNEADQDNVDWSYATPAYSADVTAGAVLRLLESVRVIDPSIRVFQPVSAMMFGDSPAPQDEQSPINPLNPYAVCKTLAYHACRYYRQVHGMHVSAGIFYNHDSVRRSGGYLLHHICRSAVAIAEGRQDVIAIGDPDMRVDIGYAGDYAEASWRIAEHPHPDDFVIGTGCAWTIREMIAEAFKAAGVSDHLPILIAEDPNFKRPGPQQCLIADVRKAKQVLGWKAKTGVDELIRELVEAAKEGKL